MADEVGSGQVAIFPTFVGFRSAVSTEVAASGTEGGNRWKDAFGAVVKGIGAGIAVGITAAVAGAGAIAAKGLDRALNIQDAKAQLTGLGHDAASVSEIMGSALASVKGTAFGLDQAATIAASAVAAGVKPGEALTRTLKLTADSATIAKAPLSEMGSIISKVATNQKLTTETLQQFQDRGIPLLQAVAKEYGVTTDAAATMVSKGQVDFNHFQNALEASVGGAALSSGTTARGAFANIGAAFSRMGALFVQPAVDGAPTLFQAIAGAVDRATEALKPAAAALAEKLTPAMAGLSAWVNTIDFGRIITGIQSFYQSAVDVKDLLLTGFTENETLLPPGVVKGLQVAHDVFVNIGAAIRDVISSFQGGAGSSEALTGQFGKIGTSLATLQPAVTTFVGQLPKFGVAAATLAGAGLTALSGGLSFLADHVDTIIQFMPLIVAGFLAWKAASIGVLAASQNLALTQLRMLPVTTANTFARLAAARAELQVAVATGASTGAQTGGFLATIRSTAASVASVTAMVAVKAAQLAGAAATGIATAAQWAFNAALTANPIGLIIAAVVALVAGLIWFFTQTELGQAIWAEFTRFLGEAWTNIVNFVTVAIDTVVGVITTVVGGIVTLWNDYWNTVSAVIQIVWGWIVDFITAYILVVLAVITAVTTTIQNVWNTVWGAISGFFTGLWNGIISFIQRAVDTIGVAIYSFVTGVQNNVKTVFDFIGGIPGTIMNTLGNLGNLLVNSGRSLIQGFIDGITGMLGKVGDAVGGVMDFIGGFFPHSPAKRGQFSGSGWRAVREGGAALIEQFQAGVSGSAADVPFSAALSAVGVSSTISATGASAAAPIFVQNPFTGEYLLAKVGSVADGRVQANARDNTVALSTGKWADA